MTSFASRSALGGLGLAALVAFAAAGASLAQNAAGTSPAWPTLVRCAEIGDESDRLNCYDAAMRAAGYAPKQEAVTAARHRLFGLNVPKLGVIQHKEKSKDRSSGGEGQSVREDDDNVTVTLGRVARMYDNKLLLITTEGAIWEQTDNVEVAQAPKEGQEMAIRRNRFGGFFCDVTRYKTVRCVRSR